MLMNVSKNVTNHNGMLTDQYTSLTGECKLYGVSTNTTESINNKVTLTTACNVTSYSLWRYREPAL